MFNIKFKKLICVVLTLMCLLPCVMVTASAEGDKLPHQPYPCYCDECIQLWNEEFLSAYPNPYFSGFSAGNTSFNGKHLLILATYHEIKAPPKHLYIYFYDSTSFDVNRYLVLSNCFSIRLGSVLSSEQSYSADLSTLDFTFNSSCTIGISSFYEGTSSEYSIWENEPTDPFVVAFYVEKKSLFPLASSAILFYKSSFPYPEAQLSDTEIFKLQFSDIFFGMMTSLHHFVVDNSLVLLVFSIALIGGVVGIVKRASR